MGERLPCTSGLSVGFSNEVDFRVGFRGSVHRRVSDFDGIRPANECVLRFRIKSIHRGGNVRRSGRVGKSHRRVARFFSNSLVVDACGEAVNVEHALVRRKLPPLQCVCRPFFFGQSAPIALRAIRVSTATVFFNLFTDRRLVSTRGDYTAALLLCRFRFLRVASCPLLAAELKLRHEYWSDAALVG